MRDPQGVACHESSAPFELKPGDGNIFSTDAVLQGDRDYTVDYTFTGRDGQSATGSFVWRTEPVNFFYAFTTPHRMTVALPDSSDKTLLDAEDGKLTVSWTMTTWTSTLMIRCVRSKRTGVSRSCRS